MKVFIKTFGCQANVANTGYIIKHLPKKDKLVDSLEKADKIIINTCGIKLTTINKIISYINSLKNKKIYVTGCLPDIIDIKKHCKDIKILKIDYKDAPSFKKERTGILRIATGCLGSCTYCAAKLARGNLKSYPIRDIAKKFKELIKTCNVIYLSSEDNGCYGYDINTNLISLLKELLRIKRNYKIRIGMMNINFVLDYLKDLIKIYKNSKIKKFIHIPVQSGSDKVLEDMNRKYKIQDFKKIVKEFRKSIPNITISTDIIVGYPTETKKDFNETIKLIKEIKPEVLNISKFSSHKKTKASKLKQLPSQEIKRRSKELTNLFHGFHIFPSNVKHVIHRISKVR